MLPLSSILVPLDGSGFAEQALPLAAELAQASGATLRLGYVHIPQATWDPGIEFNLVDPELEQEVRQRELAYLDRVDRRLSQGSGLHVESIVLNGTIAPALQDYVERSGTRLVIMTSHGRGGVGRLVLGNVADQLILRLKIPVIVIRPEELKKAGREEYSPRRILVPLDGSELAASILDQAMAFARMTRSELLLLMVVQPVPVLLPPFIWPPEKLVATPEQRELAARRYLESLKQQLRDEGLVVQSRVRTARKVAPDILRVAKDEECSLIALATHGASGLDRVMLGSVADQVVRHADVPVLVLRPELIEHPKQVPASSAVAELVAR